MVIRREITSEQALGEGNAIFDSSVWGYYLPRKLES
jgi:hypothetical protein